MEYAPPPPDFILAVIGSLVNAGVWGIVVLTMCAYNTMYFFGLWAEAKKDPRNIGQFQTCRIWTKLFWDRLLALDSWAVLGLLSGFWPIVGRLVVGHLSAKGIG